MPGVEVVVAPNDGHPARQRLRDFQPVVAAGPRTRRSPTGTPGMSSSRTGSPRSGTWSGPIPTNCSRSPKSSPYRRKRVPGVDRDDPEPEARSGRMSFSRTASPQGGFAAGTPQAMLRYLKEADRL